MVFHMDRLSGCATVRRLLFALLYLIQSYFLIYIVLPTEDPVAVQLP